MRSFDPCLFFSVQCKNRFFKRVGINRKNEELLKWNALIFLLDAHSNTKCPFNLHYTVLYSSMHIYNVRCKRSLQVLLIIYRFWNTSDITAVGLMKWLSAPSSKRWYYLPHFWGIRKGVDPREIICRKGLNPSQIVWLGVHYQCFKLRIHFTKTFYDLIKTKQFCNSFNAAIFFKV